VTDFNPKNPSEQDPFARGGEQLPSSGSQDDSADGMTVHGLLSLLQPGEAVRVQERVDRAISTIRLKNRRFKLHVRRRIAWISGSVGIAAAIVFALLFVPSQSDSQAFAALESIRSSARQGVRTYSVRMEMEIPAMNRLRDATPIRLQPQSRTGELVTGPGGRWVLTIFGVGPLRPLQDLLDHLDGVNRRPPHNKGAFGFDGTTYWVVEPSGMIRTATSMRELHPPMIWEALDTATSSAQPDEEAEPLTLESMLDRLDRGYDVSFDHSAGTEKISGRPLTIVSAKRKTLGQRPHGPTSVQIVADAQSFEVIRAQWEWTDSHVDGRRTPEGKPAVQGKLGLFNKPAIKRVFIELAQHVDEHGEPSPKTLSIFEPATYAEALLKSLGKSPQ